MIRLLSGRRSTLEKQSFKLVFQEKEMSTQFTNPPKPTFVNVIAWTTLASGVVNLFWGLGLSLTGLLSIIGIVCIPFMLLPTILGVFEIIYAAKLMSDPPQVVQPSTTIAILEIVCALVGNFFSVVVGILALVFYNDVTVKDYFARLSGPPPLAPVPPASPSSLVDPVPFREPDAPITTAADESAPSVLEEAPPAGEAPRPKDDETPLA
jgi:hypothetical protein